MIIGGNILWKLHISSSNHLGMAVFQRFSIEIIIKLLTKLYKEKLCLHCIGLLMAWQIDWVALLIRKYLSSLYLKVDLWESKEFQFFYGLKKMVFEENQKSFFFLTELSYANKQNIDGSLGWLNLLICSKTQFLVHFFKLFYMAVFRKHYSPAKALIQFQHCYLDILSSCFTPNLFCKDSVRIWTNWPLFNHQLLLPNSCPRPQKIDPDNCDYWQGIDRVILKSNDQSVPWHATYCTLDRELGKKCLGRILLESKTLRRPNLLRQGFRTTQSVVKKNYVSFFQFKAQGPS